MQYAIYSELPDASPFIPQYVKPHYSSLCSSPPQLIVQAQDELEVVEMFIEDKLWEDVRRNEPIKKIEEKQEAEEGK